MSERTLLERLRRPGEQTGRRASLDVGAATRSVLVHLKRMFSVRQGHSLTVPDYGMPDLTDFMREMPASSSAMEKSIRLCIESYEPRLRSVRVRFSRSDEDVFNLTFDIRARLVVGEESAPVTFEANLDSEGRLSIRG
jgi:type VI secretion system protein